jgi:glycosyltransferase involved in cell wall biosynthesis
MIPGAATTSNCLLTPDSTVLTSARRMKIALFIRSFVIGGAERQVFELAKRLARDKYEVILIALKGDGEFAASFNSLDDVTVVVLNGSNPLQIVLRLTAFLRKAKVQILHSFLTAPNAYSIISKLLVRDVSLILENRMALTDPAFGNPSRYLRLKSRILERFIKDFSLMADFAISNSEAGHAAIGANWKAPGAVISNGIDTEVFKPDRHSRDFLRRALGVNSNAKFAGILANCNAYKDYPCFIRSARIVADRCRNAHFISIGDDRTALAESFRRLVDELALGPVFHFLGVRTDVEKLLPGLDVLCSSSITEAFSNAICEGMACGVPCVVTDVGDSSKIVGETGVVVQPGRPEALAEGILGILNSSQQETQRLKVTARQRIVQNFSVIQMTKQHEIVYESLLSNRE